MKTGRGNIIVNNRVIFTFWEPRGEMIPYLQLCRRTWEKNLPDYEIIVLDYSNIGAFIDEGVYDSSVLRRLSLPMQKDAIMVAVLKKYGGTFMDIDTLVLQDILPIINKLKNTEVVMFDEHLAFLSARAGSHVLTQWLEGIQQKLRRLAKEEYPAAELRWDYIGNSALTGVLEGIVDNSDAPTMIRARAMDKCVQLIRGLNRGQALWDPRFAKGLNRISNALSKKRRQLLFGTVYREYLTMLDRRRYGYIAELVHYKRKFMDHRDKYLRYWFGSNLDVNAVIQRSPMIVGLHNSWTPEWYKGLSEDEVLENNCLLSKTIEHILSN